MKFKYIAVDVDGTLLDDYDHYDHQRLAADIQQLKQKGVTFIVASGNSLDALHSLFTPTLVNNYVAENGGRIIIAGHEILSHPHQPATVQALLNYAVSQLPVTDLISVSGASQTFIPAKFAAVPVPYYPHHAYFEHWTSIHEPVYNVNVNWHQQRLPQSQINQIVAKINRDFPMVNATYSGAYGIDILPQGVNKASGLNQFVKHTGGHLDQVVAIGDTSNDIEMVTNAGLGVAMQNATMDLKTIADQITAADNNHDGMLQELEQIFTLS